MKEEKFSKLFVILLAINITCLLISNIITIKTISILGIVFTAADLLFPITYILNDVFTEVYGYNKARFVVWTSFFCNLLMVIVFFIAIKIPGSPEFLIQNEFEDVLGNTPRILAASFIAFLIGSISNAIVLSKLKVKTKGKRLYVRTIVSTLVGEGLDSLVFFPIVFLGELPIGMIFKMVLCVYVLKIVIEVAFTPITYWVVRKIKEKEKIDTYDNNIKYKVI